MLESLRRDGELGDGGHYMPLDFGLLTRKTFPGPFTDVMSYIWPHKLVADGFTGAFNPWVPKAMNSVEYSTAI